MHAVISNSIESLFDSLLERLKKSRPLKPLIVFASAKLAKHFNHFAALKDHSQSISALFLDSFLEEITPLMFGATSPRLTHIERAFRLEALIEESSFVKGDEKLESALKELKSSLHMGSYKSRCFVFCDKLSKLFGDYELHGGAGFLDKSDRPFLSHSSVAEEPHQMLQRALYNALYEGPFSQIQDLLAIKPKSLYAHIAFVGFSVLPKSVFQLLSHIDASALVEVYSLMPSSHYFGDLSVYENEDHALIGALGKQKRALQRQLEDSNACHKAYMQDETMSPTLLESIKADMALMHTGVKTLEENVCLSVQFKEYTSIRLELEGLAFHLAMLADKGLLENKSAHVFVPDLERYLPTIREVFERTTAQIPYRIAGQSVWDKNPLAHSFFSILEKGQSAWDAREVQKLVEDPYFLQGLLKKDERKAFSEFVHESSFSWGYNNAHQKSYLENEGLGQFCENEISKKEKRSSLVYAIDRWLDNNFLEVANLIDKEPLAKVLNALGELFEDLVPIRKGTLLSPAEISEYLIGLLKKYCAPNFNDDQAQAHFEDCLEACESLDKLLIAKENPNAILISSALHHLKTRFSKPSSPISGFSGVIFSPFVRAHLSSADFVGILGFDDSGSYADLSSKFTSLFGTCLVEVPSALDEAKTLFLDTLLCAEKAFFISFSNLSLSGEKAHLNSLGRIFHTYIQEKFCSKKGGSLAGLYTVEPEDECAFGKSQSIDALFYGPKASFLKSWKEPIATEENDKKSELKEFTLYEISLALTNPLEWFFQTNFRTSFTDSQKVLEDTGSDLFLKSHDRLGLIYGSENLTSAKALLQDIGPEGIFGEASYLDLKESLENKEHLLKSMGIEKLFFVELCSQRKTLCKGMRKENVGVFAPLIQVENYLVRGTIQSAFDKGIVSYAKDPLKARFSKAPYALALKELGMPSACFHIQSGEQIAFKGCLKTLVEYAEFASKNPSVIYPDTLEPLLHKDAGALKKRLEEKAFGFMPEPHMQALFSKEEAIDYTLLIETFYPWAKKLQEVFDGE